MLFCSLQGVVKPVSTLNSCSVVEQFALICLLQGRAVHGMQQGGFLSVQ